MEIEVGQIDGLQVSVHLEEKNKVLKRQLKSNMLSYVGPIMKIEDTRNSQVMSVMVKFSQIIKSEEDPEAECTNYPNVTYNSYAQCDEEFVYNELKRKFNMTPFWASDNMEQVTKLR